MSDKYTKVEPKIHPITLISIISFFVIIVTLIFVFKPTDSTVIYKSYEPYATADFTEDHPYVTAKYDGSLFKKGLDKIIEKDEVVILYVGFAGCPSCQAHIGAFQKYYSSTGFDAYTSQIYYLNVSENPNEADALIADFPDIQATTPQLLVFHNGELIAIFEPISSEDATAINRSVRDFYEETIDLINA
ncbi:MAG: hypothetical protein K9L02_08500 [Acholeplasmataceae bacterium]|nr:hypothetical protein [Acholeplasmataceae bacterium]